MYNTCSTIFNLSPVDILNIAETSPNILTGYMLSKSEVAFTAATWTDRLACEKKYGKRRAWLSWLGQSEVKIGSGFHSGNFDRSAGM